MSGMPPATAASNSRSTPASSAAANSSAPTLASSSLFAVTTGLPAPSAVGDQLAGRLDAADHLDDEVDVGVGDDVVGVAGEHALGQARRRAHGDRLRTATRVISSRDPVRASIALRLLGDELDERGTDVAAAEQADADGATGRRHAGAG